MKAITWMRSKANSVYPELMAFGFRLTGWRRFIDLYMRGRNLLLSPREIHEIATRVRSRAGSLLVFGAGNDSLLWAVLNGGHPTAILENNQEWLCQVQRQGQSIPLHSVTYTTRLCDLVPPHEAMLLPDRLELVPEVSGHRWDLVLVDAPQGWGAGPGRAQSLNEAVSLVADNGLILLHDCEREGERWLIERYLPTWPCEKLTERLWCFRKPAASGATGN